VIPPGPGYQENHVALRWPLLTIGLYAPAAGLALVIAGIASGQQAFFWVTLGVFMATLAGWVAGGGQWLPYVWPAAIWLDADGVRLGGLRWAGRHPGRTRTRTAIVPRQYSQVFACPWDAVLSIGVTTDRTALTQMRRHAHRGLRLTPLGNLAVPFMRAALVVRVDLSRAEMPQIRAATGPLWSSYRAPGVPQPVWVIPTRHPVQLRQALAVLPLPAGVIRDPGPDFAGPGPVLDWVNL
jgi:hypothetical protein